MRLTRIVVTLGPATDPVFGKLVEAGLDVARVNSSHGTPEENARRIDAARRIAASQGRKIGVLVDLPGLKLRTGKMPGGQPIMVERGQRIVLQTSGRLAPGAIPVDRAVSKMVEPGGELLIDDGRLRFRVIAVGENSVTCRVEDGGPIKDNKGINVPEVDTGLPGFTPRDAELLEQAIAWGADMVGLSFVGSAKDVAKARRIAKKAGRPDIWMVAKIERAAALHNLDEILEASDALMVARGDLGVEIGPERVPVIQKKLILDANRARRPVITATQMLDSMTNAPRPTRAEASDVANAVFDGSDALMLSNETSVGAYPVESVRTMAKIIRSVEASRRPSHARRRDDEAGPSSRTADLICRNAVYLAHELDAKVIVSFTESGTTARLTSAHRPDIPVVALSPHERVAARLALCRGVLPFTIEPITSTDELAPAVERLLRRAKLVSKGDKVVLVAGAPPGAETRTNLIRVLRIP